MADATVPAAPVETPVVINAPVSKVWQDAEVKTIIGERQDAKEARRLAEADRDKFKADAEKVAKDAQKYQADLESERRKTEAFDAEQKKLRESLLEGITDPDLKELATKETLSLEALMKLGKRQPVGPSNSRLPVETGKGTDYDQESKRKPGETFQQWTDRVEKLKRPK